MDIYLQLDTYIITTNHNHHIYIYIISSFNDHSIYHYLVGPEILALVEESRRSGHISGALNTTFIALIPKVSKTSSFDEFRPISLCNFLYKIISKIIAERMRSWISRVISPEEFGFLKDRLIFDAVGAAQEGIHSIKTKGLWACLLKIGQC